MQWRGYKVHLTETCEPDQPNLLTHVATTAATDQDVTAVGEIHEGLAEKDLVPAEHLADGAYISSGVLVASREQHGVEMKGRAVRRESGRSQSCSRPTNDDHPRPDDLGAVRNLLRNDDLPDDDLTPDHLEHFLVARDERENKKCGAAAD